MNVVERYQDRMHFGETFVTASGMHVDFYVSKNLSMITIRDRSDGQIWSIPIAPCDSISGEQILEGIRLYANTQYAALDMKDMLQGLGLIK